MPSPACRPRSVKVPAARRRASSPLRRSRPTYQEYSPTENPFGQPGQRVGAQRRDHAPSTTPGTWPGPQRRSPRPATSVDPGLAVPFAARSGNGAVGGRSRSGPEERLRRLPRRFPPKSHRDRVPAVKAGDNAVAASRRSWWARRRRREHAVDQSSGSPTRCRPGRSACSGSESGVGVIAHAPLLAYRDGTDGLRWQPSKVTVRVAESVASPTASRARTRQVCGPSERISGIV